MAAELQEEIHPAHGMNRWTLEPLLLGLAWILAFGSALLAIGFAAAGLGAALAVTLVILLWAAAAVVWARVRAARKPAVNPRQSP